jgi:hypothetical protein
VVVAALNDIASQSLAKVPEPHVTPDTHDEAEEATDDWLTAAPPPMQALLEDARMVIGDE